MQEVFVGDWLRVTIAEREGVRVMPTVYEGTVTKVFTSDKRYFVLSKKPNACIIHSGSGTFAFSEVLEWNVVVFSLKPFYERTRAKNPLRLFNSTPNFRHYHQQAFHELR